jgi:cytochrome P450
MNERPEVSLPLARPCPFGPAAEYDSLREKHAIARAVLPGGYPAWLVTRHQEARAVLADPRFTTDRSHPAYPLPQKRPVPPPTAPAEPETPEQAAARRARARAASLIGMDPPEHTAARRSVIADFTARRIQAMRPRIQQIVDQRIEAMLTAGPPADLVQALSLPVPSEVICELLGVPYDRHEFFQSRSMLLLSQTAPRAQRREAIIELFGFLDALVSEKEQAPGKDLLSRQVTQHRAAGDYDHSDLVNLAFLLLVAGHETTANMISLGVLAIVREPGLLRPMVADPARLPLAVEELLRYFSIADTGTGRVALADAEIGGTLIRAGQGVIVSLLAANRDPAVFPGPAEIRPAREDRRRHVAFGYGPHQCLGQNLARAELEIVYETLFRHLPGLRLAIEPEEVPVKDDAMVYGLYELPVTW